MFKSPLFGPRSLALTILWQSWVYPTWIQSLSRLKSWTPSPSLGRPLVLGSQVIWQDVWQRPQEHACHSAKHRPVIYISPVQVHEWRRNLRQRWIPVSFPHGPHGNLVILSPLVFSGHYKNDQINRLNITILRACVQRAMERIPGKSWDILLNTPLLLPAFEPLCSRFDLKFHYDVIDDFAGFDWAPPQTRPLEERLLQQTWSLTTGTQELANRLRPQYPKVKFVSLGVDYDLFSHPQAPPPELENLPRPLLGYFGTLSERLDYDLLDRIAAAFPEATLVLIGPLRVSPERLPSRPNVRYFGPQPHDRLPAFAQAFDLGLIPFRLTQANRSLNPVKALEYMAAGIPVVSVRLPDVESLHTPPVHVAAWADDDGRSDYKPGCGAESFLHSVAQVLSLNKEERQALKENSQNHARHFTWESMALELDRSMERAPKPAAPKKSD